MNIKQKPCPACGSKQTRCDTVEEAASCKNIKKMKETMGFNEGRVERLMMVREFHQAFGLTIYGNCKDMQKEFELRKRLLDEEMKEMNQAYDEYEERVAGVHELAKEIADVEYILLGTHVALADLSSIFMSNGIDLLSVGRDVVVKMLTTVKDRYGDPLLNSFNKIFAEVHRSNMSKMGENGPIYREDGKLLKGEKYVPADLSWL